MNQIGECSGGSLFEQAFLGADAEHDLLPAAKGAGLMRHSRTREFQAVPAKRHLGR
jgi:hypothetical protein